MMADDNDNTLTKIYFTIDKNKKEAVEKSEQKIEGIFDVDIKFDEDEQTCNKQWLSVEGKSCDCQDTKDYVNALCYPEESATVCCPCDDVGLKYEIFAGIEKNTRTVIEEKESDKIEISGSILSVTLALSSLEELLGAKLESTAEKESCSRRLDNVLRETLSHIDHLDGDLDDFESVPSNVKRAMLDSILHDTTLENIHDEVLIEKTAGAHALTPTNVKPKTSNTRGSKIPVSEASGSGIETRQTKRVWDNDTSDKRFVDLKKIAESAGYSYEEIEEGLLYVPSAGDIKPNEFLPMLDKIRERKRELGLLPKKNKNEDDDVVFVGISPSNTRQKEQDTSQNPNDVSVIEIQDEEEIKRLDSLPTRQRSRNSTGEKKKDTDQTALMTIWNQPSPSSGAIPKTSQKTTAISSSTANTTPATKDSQPVKTADKTADNSDGQSSKIRTRPTRWDKTSPDGKENSGKEKSGTLVTNIKDNLPKAVKKNGDLRYVVVDGSNVARAHGNGSVFSCQGIKLCVEHFLQRGHNKITVFVPGWRQKKGTAANPIRNQEILEKLKTEGYLAFTPHKQLPSGQRVASYDDRFILDLADKEDGVIISNDQYRDFFKDKASYRRLLEERCIPYVFVGDNFMLPEDPYGQHGRSLNDILVKPVPRPRPLFPEHNLRQVNPYTHHYNQAQQYNNPRQQHYQNYNQQYHHHKNNPYNYHNYQQPCFSTDNHYYRRRENTRSQTERYERPPAQIPRNQTPNFSATQSRRESNQESTEHDKKRHARLEIETRQLFEQLKIVFGEKDQETQILSVLNNHASETDINKLTNYCLNSML